MRLPTLTEARAIIIAAVIASATAIYLDYRGGNGDGTPSTEEPNPPTPTFIPAGSPNNAWTPVVQEMNGIEMVKVPAGCFMMGSEDGDSDEKPTHEVCLSAYWVGKTEVTNAQYKACVDVGACTPPGDLKYFNNPAYADHPVVYVDWDQAREYVAWVGGSLPTEAQWDYAARGPESWTSPWGDEAATCARANMWGCEGSTESVGRRPNGASWVGALDMIGNVSEWVADWYNGNYYGTLDEGIVDPVGPVSGNRRVLRGSAFPNTRSYARCAGRYSYDPSSHGFSIGFRVYASVRPP